MLKPHNVLKRQELKENMDLYHQVEAWWGQIVLKKEGQIDRESYIVCNMGLHRKFVPDVAADTARETAGYDWLSDCPEGQEMMRFTDFFEAMFELCDNWSEGTEVSDYQV
jgi:hypothetical protein